MENRLDGRRSRWIQEMGSTVERQVGETGSEGLRSAGTVDQRHRTVVVSHWVGISCLTRMASSEVLHDTAVPPRVATIGPPRSDSRLATVGDSVRKQDRNQAGHVSVLGSLERSRRAGSCIRNH